MQHVLAVPSPQGWIGALPWRQQSCSPRWVWRGWDEQGIKEQLQGDFPLFFLNEMAGQGGVIPAVPISGCWVCGCPFPLLQPRERGPSYPVPGRFQVSLWQPPNARTPFVLHNSAFPSGLAPVAKFRNISLASGAGHSGLHIEECIHGTLPFA